jgi:hypothetical protein
MMIYQERFEEAKGAANRRRGDNTMTKRKRRKVLAMINKRLHRKLKIEPH